MKPDKEQSSAGHANLREQQAHVGHPEGQPALTEERVRAIIREELEAYTKRMVQVARFGLPPGAEAK